MDEQMTLFEREPASSGTRRVLVDDEVYCVDCLVVSRNRDDCPLCNGEVERAGYVVGNLPAGLRQPWGRPV